MPINCNENGPRAWRALLICPSAEIRGAVETALPTIKLRELVWHHTYPGVWEIGSLIAGFQVCLLDGSSDVFAALRLLAKMAAAGISVIVLHPRPHANLTLEYLRSGAIQVMTFSGEEGQLQAALDHVAARRYYSSQGVSLSGVVYGVMAGKGGSGSTTTATNLAIRLAEARPRKTLLVDLDGITGSMALLLQQKPIHSVLELAADLTRLDEDLFRKLVARVGPLDVLMAPLKPTAFQIPANELSRVIEFCRSLYDCVILDLPRCYSELCLDLARLADLLIVVATPELPAVHSTLRTISYLEGSAITSTKIKIVLNRCRDGELAINALEAALGHKVFSHISEAEKVLQGATLGDSRIGSTSAYACDVARTAQKLTNWPIALTQKADTKLGSLRLLRTLWASLSRSKREIEISEPRSAIAPHDCQVLPVVQHPLS